MCVRDMLAGAFSLVSESTQGGQALLQPASAQHAHCTCRQQHRPLHWQVKLVMDGHFSSNSVAQRCSIIDIPIQQNVPTVLDLTRADPN